MKYTNRYLAPDPMIITQKDYAQEYPLSKYPDMWSSGYLIIDKVKNDMKKKDFALMMTEMLKFEYSFKEPEWWEKLIGFGIAILGIVVGVMFCCTGSGNILIGIGQGFLAASATWAIGSVALYAIGGNSVLSIIKVISGVMQFSSIVGSIALFIGSLGTGWKAIKDFFSEKYTTVKDWFFFDEKKNITPLEEYKILDLDNVTAVDLDETIEYMFDNDIEFETLFGDKSLIADKRVSETIDRYMFKKREQKKLVNGMVDNSLEIYNNYNRNITEEEKQEIDNTIKYLQDFNRNNAPGNYEKVLGDAVFSYSNGSYDAIAMLDVKIEKQIGINMIDDDPSNSIT